MPSESQDSTDFTLLLAEWRAGDEEAGRKLIAAVYRELRNLASVYLRKEFERQHPPAHRSRQRALRRNALPPRREL